MKQLDEMQRVFGGVLYSYDSRFGNYPHGSGKQPAETRADMLRAQGRLARITRERVEYGDWYYVWVA